MNNTCSLPKSAVRSWRCVSTVFGEERAIQAAILPAINGDPESWLPCEWFFKLDGNPDLVEQEREHFRTFVKSIDFSTPATRGSGLKEKLAGLRPSVGTSSDAVDTPGAYVRLIDRKQKKPVGTFAVWSGWNGSLGCNFGFLQRGLFVRADC